MVDLGGVGQVFMFVALKHKKLKFLGKKSAMSKRGKRHVEWGAQQKIKEKERSTL